MKETVTATRKTVHSKEDYRFRNVQKSFKQIKTADLTFLGAQPICNASAAQMESQIPIVQQLIAFIRLSITLTTEENVCKTIMVMLIQKITNTWALSH